MKPLLQIRSECEVPDILMKKSPDRLAAVQQVYKILSGAVAKELEHPEYPFVASRKDPASMGTKYQMEVFILTREDIRRIISEAFAAGRKGVPPPDPALESDRELEKNKAVK